jgi:hypothetical protein
MPAHDLTDSLSNSSAGSKANPRSFGIDSFAHDPGGSRFSSNRSSLPSLRMRHNGGNGKLVFDPGGATFTAATTSYLCVHRTTSATGTARTIPAVSLSSAAVIPHHQRQSRLPLTERQLKRTTVLQYHGALS